MNASYSSESGAHSNSMSSGDFFINIAFTLQALVPSEYLLRPFRPILRRFGVNVEAEAVTYIELIMKWVFLGLFHLKPKGTQPSKFFITILLFQTMSLLYPDRATLTGPIDSEGTDFGRCPRLRAIFHDSSVLWMLFNSDPGLKRFVPDGIFANDGNDWQWYGLGLLILYRSFDFIQMAICGRIVCRTSGMMLQTAGIYALLSADHRLMTTLDPKNHDESAELHLLILISLCNKSIYDIFKKDCVKKQVESWEKPQNVFTITICSCLFFAFCFKFSFSPLLLIALATLMHLVIAMKTDVMAYISTIGYLPFNPRTLSLRAILKGDYDKIKSRVYVTIDRRSLRRDSYVQAMWVKMFVGAALAWMCAQQGASDLRAATAGFILGLVLEDIRKLNSL